MEDEGLDFSGLTDDQLIALIRGALQEAATRTPECQMATQAAVFDEAEAARIKREAALEEAVRVREEAAQRIAKEAAAEERRRLEAETHEAKRQERQEQHRQQDILRSRCRLLVTASYGLRVKVWMAGADEDEKQAGIFHLSPEGVELEFEALLFYTGNERRVPGTFGLKPQHGPQREEIRRFLTELCEQHDELKLDVKPRESRQKGAKAA
jgi:hypothetical protein